MIFSIFGFSCSLPFNTDMVHALRLVLIFKFDYIYMICYSFANSNLNKKQSLRGKDVKHSHGGQSMLLLNWLFQDEFLFQAIATNLAKIIATKDDRFIALGWCTLVRGLLEFESATNQYPLNGNKAFPQIRYQN